MATDRINQLAADSSVEFRQMTGARLPFEDGKFDLVISNHVIEHVGDSDDQMRHLQELARVVKRDGTIYLATPNRWAVFEPHFRLPFLSWLPPSARSPYVRLAHRGTEYDCTPLTRPQLGHLFHRAGLLGKDATHLALRYYGELEMAGIPGRMISILPNCVTRMIARVWCIPSLIFLLTPRQT